MASSTHSKDLAGKTALVTGSSRGIGAAISLALAARGMNVIINYASSLPAAEATAAKARALGVRAICIQANVSVKHELEALFAAAIKEFGTLHLVMSNSGIEHFGALDTVTEESIDKTFAVNVKGQFFVAQEAYKYLADNGRLILTSSISAQKGFPQHAIYSASKAAIQGMIRCLAWDFGPRGITVNCLAYGGVKTDMWAEYAAAYFGDKDMPPDEVDRLVAAWSPFGRPGYPEDVAGFITLLARPESQWMTGQTFHLSGGAFM